MLAVGKDNPGPTAQTSLYAILNSWDVRSGRQSETVDEEAAMQRLLTEAYDEFELEERETAEVPVSVYALGAIRRTSRRRQFWRRPEGCCIACIVYSLSLIHI